MGHFISYSSRKDVTVYTLFLQEKGASEGTGRIFDCSKTGKVIADSREWFNECVASGNYEVGVIQEEVVNQKIPAVFECKCGKRHSLWTAHDFNCERCGQEYNGSGQELAPRSLWYEGGDY